MTDDLAWIGSERRKGSLVVTLAGEVDLSNAEQLQARIERILEPGVPLVIDLSAVEYIDSQGLRLLSELARACDAGSAGIELVAPRDTFAREVLELTRMRDELPVRDRLDSA
jgi:anti-anti-sigma factor